MASSIFLLGFMATAQATTPLPPPPAPGPAPVPAEESGETAPLETEAAAPPVGAEAGAEAAAGQDDAPVDTEDEGEEIVVTGQRQRGAVDTDIPAEDVLNRRDIRATGASTLAELLEAIAPQTRSGRGREDGGPVTLLNGRRISGFAEIRDLPPEAIERVDILPEEVALQYGYRADQRVVNFVLRRRFRAVTAEVEGGLATAGGRGSGEFDINVLRLNRNGRFTVDAEYQREAGLLESERDIIQAAGGPADPAVPSLAPFRSLLPATEQASFGGTVNRTLFGNVSTTLNGRYEIRSSNSRLGLPSFTLDLPGGDSLFRYAADAGPLDRFSDSRNLHLGLSMNGDVKPWRWSLTGNFDRNRSETLTERGVDAFLLQERIDAGNVFDPVAPIPFELLTSRPGDRSNSLNTTATAELVVSGPLFDLPAGGATASVRVGADTRDLSGETFRSGVITERNLGRDRGNVQASVNLPIASRRRAVLGPLGDLSVNFNAELERLSDFGTLRTLGAGLNWSPIEEVSLIASVTDEDGAPSIGQLGDPTLETPNVRVFDFVRGETVDISRIDGGNPLLAGDRRRVLKLGATVRPFEKTDLSLTANYTDNSIRNPIASFPTATPEIEAAFPDRFTRDADGRLLRIDARPVNFARSDRRELRWGLNYSRSIGPEPQGRPGRGGGRGGQAGAADGAPAAGGAAAGAPGGQPGAQPGAQGGGGQQGAAGAGARREGGGAGGRGGFGAGGGGGRGGFGGGGGRGGRLNFGLYHTWRFEDSVLIRPGVPELDFLGGSASGNRGGRPRHELELQAGVFKDGFGARLTGTWQEGTFVRGGPTAGGTDRSDLFFSSTATANLRLFANLGQRQEWVKDLPFLRGSRVTLAIDNLFDTRPRVRDNTGATPLSYQPASLDPLGRSVRISLRKMFF
ncbi:MAG TPA: TonB-dependent receptor [Allosphingosinicella sp.]